MKKTLATDGKIITMTGEYITEELQGLAIKLQAVTQAIQQKQNELNELQARALRLDERIRFYHELSTQLTADLEAPNGENDSPTGK